MRLLLAVVSVVGALAAPAAFAMPYCGDREAVVSALTEQFSEHHFASGLQSETGLMEIWVSDSTGTWTILMTRPDGKTCILTSGTHWLEQRDVEMAAGDQA